MRENSVHKQRLPCIYTHAHVNTLPDLSLTSSDQKGFGVVPTVVVVSDDVEA